MIQEMKERARYETIYHSMKMAGSKLTLEEVIEIITEKKAEDERALLKKKQTSKRRKA